mmetsp:Transcript_18166/g.2959  ORF Transcript_18166/g.2959 Transcript_18166/m.2959 type:complete len:81 (-) Transcript_18166:106-348(-)
MLIIFAESITRNQSLNELICEGTKIGNDPDSFCEIIGEAIRKRKLSLTFKISAVNCFTPSLMLDSLKTSTNSHISSSISL